MADPWRRHRSSSCHASRAIKCNMRTAIAAEPPCCRRAAIPVLLTLVLLLLLPPALPARSLPRTWSSHASAVPSASSTSPAMQPMLVGSGLRLSFSARPKQSYCLLTDPCLHVNVLIDAPPRGAESSDAGGGTGEAGVSAESKTLLARKLGIRSGAHTVELWAGDGSGESTRLGSATQPLLGAALLDGVNVQAAIAGSVTAARPLVRSDDGEVELEAAEGGRSLLVTLSRCRVRLLLRLLQHRQEQQEQGGAAERAAAGLPMDGIASPFLSSSSSHASSSSLESTDEARVSAPSYFSVEVLDWDMLSGPHGIMGQIFPNRATKREFARTSHTAEDTIPSSTSFPSQDSLSHLPLQKENADGTKEVIGLRNEGTWRDEASMAPITEALRRLEAMQPAASELDGVPEDYLTTGLLEPDCIFSRFDHEDAVEAAPSLLLLFPDDDSDDESARGVVADGASGSQRGSAGREELERRWREEREMALVNVHPHGSGVLLLNRSKRRREAARRAQQRVGKQKMQRVETAAGTAWMENGGWWLH